MGKTKTLEECRTNIQEFANRFKLIFEDKGECGFGRECVGLTNGNNWVDYNPSSEGTYEIIDEYYSEILYDIVPEDAYHKHACIAVLGRGEKAIRQLDKWVDDLNNLGATVEVRETGATGLQALFSGTHVPTIKLP